ncbi:MAG: DUF853 domain-containing protein [Ignavibacteriales bacterium]|nr:DUF853 domain-containing protein [Ignavibacteriales bacterium]
MVERAFVLPPHSRIGPLHAGGARRRSSRARSSSATTRRSVDRESAYEMLKARAEKAAAEAQAQAQARSQQPPYGYPYPQGAPQGPSRAPVPIPIIPRPRAGRPAGPGTRSSRPWPRARPARSAAASAGRSSAASSAPSSAAVSGKKESSLYLSAFIGFSVVRSSRVGAADSPPSPKAKKYGFDAFFFAIIPPS